MTVSQAKRLQSSRNALQSADTRLGREVADEKIVEAAEEYMSARRTHQKVITELEENSAS